MSVCNRWTSTLPALAPWLHTALGLRLLLLRNMATQCPEEWERMLDMNVKGLLNGIHATTTGMVDRNHGTIINISSVAGQKKFSLQVAYVGTKFAVHGISENLREELSPPHWVWFHHRP